MPENPKNLKIKESSSDCGVLIDIDGVVLKGGKPFEFSKDSLHKLWNNNIPFAFLTNGTYTSAAITNSMRSIFNLPFEKDHFIVAPSPCQALNEYHDKNVLVCCQEDAIDLIAELGFKSYITIPELSNIFPDLDFVDHNRRIQLNANSLSEELKRAQEEFKPIEAILLLGEPINWECHLQILIDVLMLNGDPRNNFKMTPKRHLPIIACNKDITFKGAAQLPRFGHGAFLECLEVLYKKITNNDLMYEVFMGKPYMITYEFATIQIQKLSQKKHGKKIKKFFMIGDNPDVDVKGANKYRQHLSKSIPSSSDEEHVLDINHTEKTSQIHSILVSTGVYNPNNDIEVHIEKTLKHATVCEKQEMKESLLTNKSYVDYFHNQDNIPDLIVSNLSNAVDYIVKTNI